MLLCSVGLPQTTPDSVPRSPQDAKSLFLQAVKANGLSGDDLKPWHLKVSYRLLDVSGQPADQGTIEEFWAGPKLGRLIITSTTSKLIYLRTEKAAYREGDLDRKMALLRLLSSAFASPMPFSDKSLALLDLSLKSRAIGSSQLPCFSLKVRGNAPGNFNDPTFNDPTYCLESNLPIVRIVTFANDPHWFMSNHVGKFQGRYVASDITAGKKDQTELTAHLDVLEEIPNFDSADFAPGPNAVLQNVPERSFVFPNGMPDKLADRHFVTRAMRNPQPQYPASAQAANIHGTVTMHATIGTDGHIAALYVIDGPEMLQQAALDAVWKWRFEEPFYNGKPVQVLTVIAVRF
jgi:TonB family protein